ncbi:MAG: hypothetical protein R2710_08025 [Acidimicrobiales bacterium]
MTDQGQTNTAEETPPLTPMSLATLLGRIEHEGDPQEDSICPTPASGSLTPPSISDSTSFGRRSPP